MILVAKIVNTHGLRGEVKALYYTDGPAFFDTVKRIFLASGKSLTLSSWRQNKGAVLLKFKEISSVEEAEAIVGQTMYVRRTDLPPLPEEEQQRIMTEPTLDDVIRASEEGEEEAEQ